MSGEGEKEKGQQKGPLDQQVKKWIQEQGYPLEMEVAKAFEQSRMVVQQSVYYTDRTTQKLREIDVLAEHHVRLPDGFLRVVFPVECKVSKKPWVVFTGRILRVAGERRVRDRVASSAGARLLDALHDRDDSIARLGLFGLPSRPGYAVTAAFTKGTDHPYKALMGVAGSAAAVVHRARGAVVAFPIVVIEGKLFECSMNADGALDVVETTQSVLVWKNRVASKPMTIIHVATKEGLASLVGQARTTADELAGHPDLIQAACTKPKRRTLQKGIEW